MIWAEKRGRDARLVYLTGAEQGRTNWERAMGTYGLSARLEGGTGQMISMGCRMESRAVALAVPST